MAIDLDKVAVKIRNAYLLAVGETWRDSWASMPDHRKVKWRLMADAAVTEIMEQVKD
jgi:hypothetical protein